MRAINNGVFFTVQCSEQDVRAFAERWPCFGPRQAMWFQFDKKNGDLVDMGGDTDENDASGVKALSEDAQAYGEKRLYGWKP